MNKDFIIYNQNCKEIPNLLAPNSIDCIITDPPYELTNKTSKKTKEFLVFFNHSKLLKIRILFLTHTNLFNNSSSIIENTCLA